MIVSRKAPNRVVSESMYFSAKKASNSAHEPSAVIAYQSSSVSSTTLSMGATLSARFRSGLF